MSKSSHPWKIKEEVPHRLGKHRATVQADCRRNLSVGVFPLVADAGHGIDEVEDQISVSIWIESQHDHVVVNRVPVRHVNRAVAVEHGMNRFVGGDVAKAYRHPRAGLMSTVQFNRVDSQMLVEGRWSATKVVACGPHPMLRNGGSRAFSENNPVARLVHSKSVDMAFPLTATTGVAPPLRSNRVFTRRAADCGTECSIQSVLPGHCSNTEVAIGRQRSEEQRAVG